MEVAIGLAAWAMGSFCSSLPAGAENTLIGRFCQEDKAPGLASRLSSGAQIYFPGSNEFSLSTTRWSTLDAPNVTITVEPATENDVAETVKYANERGIPFIAVNSGHGAITTVGGVKNGIEIWMRSLNKIKIAKDGKTATFGGGVQSKKVTETLWAAKKQTGMCLAKYPKRKAANMLPIVTGGCECVSMLGPGLGGGHGFLQGRHGLIADQFVSMNIVRADGSINTIDRTSDLWWAMQGAGHNFGIVTSVTSKIYDVVHPTWAYQSFIFSGKSVEGLYGAINDNLLKNGTQPVDIMEYSFFFNSPDIDPENVSAQIISVRAIDH